MKILIFDTETSGLPKTKEVSIHSVQKWPYILQLSYILYDTENNDMLKIVNTLIDIDINININPDSFNIHKISKEMCKKNGEPIQKILYDFNNVLNESDLLIGHNLQFDKNMLMIEYIRNGILHNFNPKNNDIPEFCTMRNGVTICELTYKTKQGHFLPKYPKLLELYKYYFTDVPNGLHNAMVDVIITLRCYYKMQFDLDIFECSMDINALKDKYLI